MKTTGKEKMLNRFIVVVDTREQQPLIFPRVIFKPLPAGDYTAGYPANGRLLTFEKIIAIERKRVEELFTICGSERERFESELEKLSKLQYRWVVIEGNLGDLSKMKYSMVTPKTVLCSICSWSIKYNIPFLFCGRSARSVVYKLLEFFVKYQVLGFKTLPEIEETQKILSRWEKI